MSKRPCVRRWFELLLESYQTSIDVGVREKLPPRFLIWLEAFKLRFL